MKEQVKQYETDNFRYKEELNQERENCFKKLQEQENDRIQKRTENAILQEKLNASKCDLEKVVSLEFQLKTQAQELRQA